MTQCDKGCCTNSPYEKMCFLKNEVCKPVLAYGGETNTKTQRPSRMSQVYKTRFWQLLREVFRKLTRITVCHLDFSTLMCLDILSFFSFKPQFLSFAFVTTSLPSIHFLCSLHLSSLPFYLHMERLNMHAAFTVLKVLLPNQYMNNTE